PYDNALPFMLDGHEFELPYRLLSNSQSEVVFQRQEGSLLITKRYLLSSTDYMSKLIVTIKNVGTGSINIKPSLAIKGRPLSSDSRFAPNPDAAYFIDGKATFLKDSASNPAQLEGTIGWAGTVDKYFLRAIVLPASEKGTVRVHSGQQERVFITEVIGNSLE